MTPGRFSKMVEKEASGTGARQFLFKRQAVQLLRREHAGVVRLVKEQRKQTGAPYDRDYLDGYQRACDDILAALAARRGRGR